MVGDESFLERPFQWLPAASIFVFSDKFDSVLVVFPNKFLTIVAQEPTVYASLASFTPTAASTWPLLN